MPAVVYGTGALYGAGAYGRISAALAAAQEQTVRETALKISLIDERSNRWEKFTGTALGDLKTIFGGSGGDATTQTYWSYRSHCAAAQKANGDIVRVRIGDGTAGNYNVYTQTITDTTIASQWTTWNLLYAGTHYGIGVVIALDGSTVIVYTSKSDGLYKNNALVWSHNNIIIVNTIDGLPNAVFVHTVKQDAYDGFRTMDVYFTHDITSQVPLYDWTNYRWYDMTIDGIYDAVNDQVIRFQTMPRYDPRAHNNGDSICVAKTYGVSNYYLPDPFRIIRGLAGEVGHNTLRNLMVSRKLGDGYYYIFYHESHKDSEFEDTSNIEATTHWQRSKDGIHWSEPVASGTPVGIGIFQADGYYWLPAFDEVWRRPDTSVVYDVSNYTPRGSFDIPRDNQEASGELTLANPAGVNNALRNLSDRRLKIEVGLKVATGAYEYVEFNDWWIKRIIGDLQGDANRLTVQFGDIWNRLSGTLRDTFNFVGQLKWRDWASGNRNKAFNYYFLSDTNPVDTGDKLVTAGICLYTGWKGQNGTVEAHFSSVTGLPSVIFRYVDARNYHRMELNGTDLFYYEKVNNVDTLIQQATVTADSTPTIKVEFQFENYQAWVNGTIALAGAFYPSQANVKGGYVGFKATRYTITNFSLDDWEAPITGEELIRTALAMGDYHDVITGDTSSEELAIIWGPQTDAPTPADGLRMALEATKWDLVWHDGRIQVGSFSDPTITRVIDNRIIKTDYVDEANRHINLAAVDGNEDPWIETDVPDTQQRDRQISAYYDLPELTSADAVRDRALEEIRKGKLGRTPGGDVILYFDLWRMDVVTWIDNSGESNSVRAEGISVDLEQGMTPSQRETLDTSLLNAT